MRWKPAKAFLLDERNVLIREFGVNADCPVTLEELTAHGGAPGVTAPIRVGRFYAQTVRANGLALVVVGQGRAPADQAEFARRLLLAVQEGVPEWVKDRIELSRIEEAHLDATRRSLEAQSSDVQARVRGAAGLWDATSAAHARMAAEASALSVRAAALAAGEASVAEREANLARGVAELRESTAESEASIARARTEFESQARQEKSAIETLRADLEAKSEALDARETDTLRRQAALEDGERALAGFQAKVAEWEMRSTAMQREFDATRDDQARRMDELTQREALVAARDAEIRSQLAALEARMAEHARQAEDLAPREAAVATKGPALEALAKQIGQRERALEDREREAERFFEQLATNVARNARWERELTAKAEALEQLEKRPAA